MTRLIDADALHDDLRAKQKWIVKRDDKHNEGYTYDQVHFAIDEQPTVDAVPVRHGHWVGIDDEPHEVWECDMCGYTYESEYQYNFCPHCGADMKGEKKMDDLISRQAAIARAVPLYLFGREVMMVSVSELENLPSAQPELPIKEKCCYCPHCTNCDVNDDLTINQPEPIKLHFDHALTEEEIKNLKQKITDSPIVLMPSAQPEPRYTEEELRVFQHGISLSLLSKRSAQHWQYDEDTATEIKFLERLYEKVGADMRGGQG